MLSKYRQVVLLVLYFHLQVHGEPDPGPDAAHHGQYQAQPGAVQINIAMYFMLKRILFNSTHEITSSWWGLNLI